MALAWSVTGQLRVLHSLRSCGLEQSDRTGKSQLCGDSKRRAICRYHSAQPERGLVCVATHGLYAIYQPATALTLDERKALVAPPQASYVTWSVGHQQRFELWEMVDIRTCSQLE